MQKNLITSLCVVLGVAGVVFGAGFLTLAHVMDSHAASSETVPATTGAGDAAKAEKSEGEHGAAHGAEKPKSESEKGEKPKGEAEKSEKPKGESEKSEKAHGESHEKPADSTKPPPVPTSPAILAEIESKFNELLARNQFDSCREVALKALTLPGHNHAAWQLRLATSTAQSESLPKQQRFTKALELFSAAQVQGLEPLSKEAAQYGICVSLRQLSRWEDLTQAADAYMKEFKLTVHTPEVMLFHALGMSAEGRNADARAELDSLTGDDIPDAIRAQALWQIAQLNLKDAEAKISEPATLVNKENLTLRDVLPAELPAPAPALRHPVNASANAEPRDLPESQWQSISRALERSDYAEAQRLLDPYLEAADADQRARISIKYANMMVKIAVDNRAGGRRK